MDSMPSPIPIQEFLGPLEVDEERICELARAFTKTYKLLARNSKDQFLGTPISESLLPLGSEEGRYLAIDLGGSNLRVGFIELLGNSSVNDQNNPLASENPISKTQSIERLLERCWPIEDRLKNENAEGLFAWVGKCIAEVLEGVYSSVSDAHSIVLPMGVTFSFPMIQDTTLDNATLMPMGKGFAITSNLDLRKQLLAGYAAVPNYTQLPRLRIVAISNDAVSTLVAFIYQHKSTASCRRPAMAIIVGTGNNATIPIPPNFLHPSKRPLRITKSFATEKIVINTEWSIKGTALPLQQLNFVTCWDSILDANTFVLGFMPFEYMTSGRYIGELCRIIVLDYFTSQLDFPNNCLPEGLKKRDGFDTTFIGNLKKSPVGNMVESLKSKLPFNSADYGWTEKTAEVVYEVAKAVEKRAAAMLASAIVALLAFAGDVKMMPPNPPNISNPQATTNTPMNEELLVGYTGGCISHFQDYLTDCQKSINLITPKICEPNTKITLEPCHDGGIIGAGILAGKVMSMRRDSIGSTGDSLSDGGDEESFESSSTSDEDGDEDGGGGDLPVAARVDKVDRNEVEDEGFAEDMDFDDGDDSRSNSSE